MHIVILDYINVQLVTQLLYLFAYKITITKTKYKIINK